MLDLLAQDDSGYRHLYYRWEQEQWEAGKIDLDEDRARWAAVQEPTRGRIVRAVDWRRCKAEMAATALPAFVDAAPAEEQQVFLTTQLADEARAAILLDRVATNVFEESRADMGERSSSARDALPAALGALLHTSLAEPAQGLRDSDHPAIDLVDAVARYHLCIVGALGLVEIDALLTDAVQAEDLPGLAGGIELLRRDALRHVAFGLRFVEENASGTRGRARLQSGLNAALPAIAAALDELATGSEPSIGEELQNRAREALSGWLRALKLGSIPSLL